MSPSAFSIAEEAEIKEGVSTNSLANSNNKLNHYRQPSDPFILNEAHPSKTGSDANLAVNSKQEGTIL